jgi:N-acetylneuraminic acid mutarotase
MTSLGSTVVLFGGYGAAASLNDTWTFNGSTWTEITVATPPAARNGHAMATLGGTRAVLFGGYDTVALSDTWIFDGTTWTQSTATGPTARNNQVMAAFP